MNPHGRCLVVGAHLLAFSLGCGPASGPGTFSATSGQLAAGRENQTATLLANGTVLLVGGIGDSFPLKPGAEVFDPATGTFSGVDALGSPRMGHTATLLRDGRVLIVGGSFDKNDTAALTFDPTTGAAKQTGPTVHANRHGHAATLLEDGKVLVVGGQDYASGTNIAEAELFDPTTDTFSATAGGLATPRLMPTVTLLRNGKVLVAGGNGSGGNLSSAELFDPRSGTFSSAGPMASSRFRGAATLLRDGQVLMTGGLGADDAPVELYDPSLNTFSTGGKPVDSGRIGHSTALLPDGRVLVVGGLTGKQPNGAPPIYAELYDPSSKSLSPTHGALGTPRVGQTATVLPSGKVLIAGGTRLDAPALAPAELYW